MWHKSYRVAHDKNSVKSMSPRRQHPNMLKELCVHKAQKESIRNMQMMSAGSNLRFSHSTSMFLDISHISLLYNNPKQNFLPFGTKKVIALLHVQF